MLDLIAGELVTDLKVMFPNLVIRSQSTEPHDCVWVVVDFDILNCVIVRLSDEAMKTTIWVGGLAKEVIKCPYCDPEVFDRVQSFISEHYEAYLLDQGAPQC